MRDVGTHNYKEAPVMADGKRRFRGKDLQSRCGSVETIEIIEPEFGGASRDRTDDLIVANDALSQLSYSPIRLGRK